MAATKTADTTIEKVMGTVTPKTRAAKRDFAGIVKDVKSYCAMKISVLEEVSGPTPSERTVGQLAELKAVLGKLETK